MEYFDDLEFILFGDYHLTKTAYQNHRFDYCGIQFIYDGSITLNIGENAPVTADAPVVFFTYPGQSFSYGNKRNHICICFRGPRMERYIETGFLPINEKEPFIKVHNPKKLLTDFRKLLQHCFIPEEIHHAQAVLELESILLHLKNQQKIGYDTLLKSKIITLGNEISYSPCKNWDFAKESSKLKISITHFRRVFKALLSTTPRHYLTVCRMRHAASLLSSSGKMVKEIAFECGYSSEFHFSREFKRIMSLSPIEYRKKYH